ncbi:MAG: hypothetical protein ACRC57_00500 [Sarcina sp.]
MTDLEILIEHGMITKDNYESRGYTKEDFENALEIRDSKMANYTEAEIGIAKFEQSEIRNMKLEEKRSMDIKQIIGIDADRGISKEGQVVNSGFTKGANLIEPIPSIVDKCLNVTSDSNTGISVIPIIDENGISYVEVKAEGFEKELVISQEIFNSLSEEDIKTQLDIMIKKAKEDRIALELEKVESTGSKLTDLFTIAPRFVGDNYIMCNQNDLVKISALTLGSEIALEYKRIGDKLIPVINEVPVIVNDNVTKVILFTPKYIGISNLALDETEEIVTTDLRRSGKKMWRRYTGMSAKVLIAESIRAITLA